MVRKLSIRLAKFNLEDCDGLFVISGKKFYSLKAAKEFFNQLIQNNEPTMPPVRLYVVDPVPRILAEFA